MISRLRVMIALLMLALLTVTSAAQTVRAVVTNEFGNIRILPALGAEVLGSVSAGFLFDNVNGRSADGEWLRVSYFGQEGWVNFTTVAVLDGDVNALPVADPRSIPYGGFEAPRAGQTNATGAVAARATDNLRIRSGPSRAYPTLGSIFTNEGMTLTGRTESNGWYQVSYNNLLGWVSSQYVAILSGDPNALPIDGIVASGPPQIGDGPNEFYAVLRLLLDRLNLAQPSLDIIRGYWTDSALTGRAACQPYPAQPSDTQIATPVLAAYYATLEPLRVDFNDAMFNVRQAIDLFIEVCNQPGTGNPVGQATVEGALGIINTAQAQFDSLRARISALLPPENDGSKCLLSYNGRTELLPIINVGQIYIDEFNSRNYATGYCFDAVQGQNLNFQVLPFPDSNVEIFLSVSPLDSPTSFIAVNRSSANTRLLIGPVAAPRTTRYVVIIADFGDRTSAPKGKFAVLVSSVITESPPVYLVYNTESNSILTSNNPGDPFYSSPSQLTATQFAAGTATPTSGAPVSVCPSTSFSCNQLFSCSEAQACLAAGNFLLDSNNNSIPCEPSETGGVTLQSACTAP